MHADFSVELGRDDAALEMPWSSADPAVRYHDLKKHPELLRQIPEAVAYPELGVFLARINAAGFPLATAKCDAWTSREVAPEEEIFGDRKFVSYIDLVFEDEAARYSFERHEAFAKNLCRLLSQTPEIPAAVEVVIRRCYFHGEDRVADAREMKGGGGLEVKIEFEAEGRGGVGDEDAVEVEYEPEGGAGAGEADDAADGAEVGNKVGSGRAVVGGDAAGVGEAPAEDIHLTDLVSGPRGLAGGFCFTAYVTGFGDSDHEPELRWQIALALLQNALVQLAR